MSQILYMCNCFYYFIEFNCIYMFMQCLWRCYATQPGQLLPATWRPHFQHDFSRHHLSLNKLSRQYKFLVAHNSWSAKTRSINAKGLRKDVVASEGINIINVISYCEPSLIAFMFVKKNYIIKVC